MTGIEATWERLKRRSIRLQLADQTDEQTHINHALLTVVLFGGSGMLGTLLFLLAIAGVWSTWVATTPLACGIVAGWCFYLVREVLQRRGRWTWMLWDGICDIVVPLAWTAPWTLAALAGTVPWWTGAVLYGSALLMLALYYVFRPIPEPAE